ncbi:MAG: hypothetical protein PHQ76_00090 [Caldisericia bacterium]|nr:hypothetical protein [Caldisericia bacterium]
MSLPKEAIDEFKEIYKKNYEKELTDAEASEAANNLVGLFKLLYDCSIKELQRKQRLKKEPEGFHLDGEYTCCICHRQVAGNENWYDKWGIKCLLCQKTVKEGLVPPFVCKDRDSWYAMFELQSKFGIKHQTAKKMVRLGELKAKIVPYENGNPYEYVFLKKENPNLIDPDRYSPARKSYDRNYNKVMDARIRKEKLKR